MRWRNTEDRFGAVAIGLHWGVAVVVVGLFALGLWMRTLDYYHAWYEAAPHIHRSVGVLLGLVLVARLVWRWGNPSPLPLPTWTLFERRAATLAHGLLYGGLFILMLSGYLISTANGQPIEVFGLFQVPATLTDTGFEALRTQLGQGLARLGWEQGAGWVADLPKQADLAGGVHRLLAYGLMALAALHALAALKHHFIDRDRTLARMLGGNGP